MILLEQFKKELGITELKFVKSAKTGRQFANVGTVLVMISIKGIDKSKPLYVTTAKTKEQQACFVVCNSTLVEGDTL